VRRYAKAPSVAPWELPYCFPGVMNLTSANRPGAMLLCGRRARPRVQPGADRGDRMRRHDTRYAKAPSAHFRHCTPDRLTRRDNYCNDRDWAERQWISCRYLMGVPAVLVHHGVERQEPTPELVS
jgi:hypothetical protein